MKQQKTFQSQRGKNVTKSCDTNARRSVNSNDGHQNSRIKSNRKIESMIAMMTASFYVCWTPYAARAIFELFGAVPSAHLSVLVLLFAKLGVIINPIMYIFSNKEVRFSLRINIS